ncbi:MAG: 4-hydroxy-3-methylbut-2-enyl diphosphate reductase [Prevotella sp.]|nr:4-hydroxy-3-methylbut-2-enyl diphosphate reductase [Prevotella sp.]
MIVEIDANSGFCFGVTAAIRKAEEQLFGGRTLYCLGDIVHNGPEVRRLAQKGLITINHDELVLLHDTRVLLRAHGEPPETYETAERNNIELVDATCPVVLALQRRIRAQYVRCPEAQIVIFGKKGHAEVLGLVGQTDGRAIVVEQLEDTSRLDYDRDIYLYSQTTSSEDEYRRIIDYCSRRIARGAVFRYSNTVCRQVANRIEKIRLFAASHDVIIFVCGGKSSNGEVLYRRCRDANPASYLVESASEIDPDVLRGAATVGICGATSTPTRLMEECKSAIERMFGIRRSVM